MFQVPRVVIEIVVAIAIFVAGMATTGRFGIEVSWACNNRTTVAMFPSERTLEQQQDE